jgi:5'-3' exonuclease
VIGDVYEMWPDECETVICTRDKDLRMVPGWQYGWECGAQREYGPVFVEHMGEIELLDKKPAKLVGTGLKFFYSQLLTGDSVDNIPGLPRCGPVAAFKALQDLDTEKEMFSVVREMYNEKGFDDAYLLEQGQLLWMVQETTEEGKPVLWQFPN